MQKNRFLYILAGGFIGSALREIFIQNYAGPSGTLIVNVLGCFVLGYLMYATELGFFTDKERYLVGTGFCGGLTTFSTFMVQTMQLSGYFALGNIFANIFFCLVSVFLGRAAALKGLGT